MSAGADRPGRRATRGLRLVTLAMCLALVGSHLAATDVAHASTANPCWAEATVDYDATRFFGRFEWRLDECSFAWIYGSVTVRIELQRQDIGRAPDDPIIHEEVCAALTRCEVEASIPHLPVDVANYRGVVEYGSEKNQLNGFSRMEWATCGSYVIRYGCPIPLHPPEPGDVLPH